MKRVLCIVSSLNTGGAETFLMKVFRRLPDGYKMDFVVSATGGYYEPEVERLGGRVFAVPLRTKEPVKVFKELKRITKENKYNAVLKLCDTPIGYLDILAAKRGGATRLCVRSCNASSSERKTMKAVNNFLRPAFNKLANVKIAPSDLAAEYTFGKKQVEKGNVHFLHNAVDLDVFRYGEEERAVTKRELGIEDKLVIGHIGRFNHQKNHDFLLDIFKEIKKKNENAALLLVGKGELESQIKEKIARLGLEESVVFTGVRSDIPALLSAMDVFVFPSFYEGMPNTVIEAQATGLPCVIADTITREANVTGLVEYLPLSASADEWAECAIVAADRERIDTKQMFIDNKYDIESTVSSFIELVFGEQAEV